MVFKLVRVDTADPCKIQLPAGTHLFGRKVFLDCEDKRVSRSHGQLEVTADAVILKALHQNPCFYKRKASEETVTLKLNCIADLSHGDKFGLLPNSFWYELLHCPDIPNDIVDNAPNLQANGAANAVESNEHEELQANGAKNPVESNQDEDIDGTASQTITNVNNDQELDPEDEELLNFDMNESIGNITRSESPSVMDNPPPAAATDNQEPAAPSTDNHQSPERTPSPDPPTPSKRVHSSDDAGYDAETPKKIKAEPVDVGAGTSDGSAAATVQAGPSSADVKVKPEPPASPVKPPPSPATNAPAARERCMYGARCYRKNPQHKAQFSHPHDSDWGAGARVPCPYGAQCQKRDPRHYRDHEHPPGVQPPPPRQPQAHQPGQAKKPRRKRDSSSDSGREVSPTPDAKLPAKRPRKAVKRQSWSGSEAENNYDMDDPFMTDGSEDEWEPQSSDLNTQSQSQDL